MFYKLYGKTNGLDNLQTTNDIQIGYLSKATTIQYQCIGVCRQSDFEQAPRKC